MNKFYEQFITKNYGNVPNIINILSKVMLLFSVLFILIFKLILAIQFFLIFIILEILIVKNFIEFEYEYFNGDITISKIINKKRRKVRKVICEFNVNNIVRIYKMDIIDKNITKCTIKNLGLNEIVIFINTKNNKKCGYLIGLDKELYSILKKVNPSLFNYI